MHPLRNPVGWFEIYVQDMERARSFYEKTLNVNLVHLGGPDGNIDMWAFPPFMATDSPGCGGALVKMKDKDSGAGGTIIYFSCEDCAVECSRVIPSGGSVHFEKMAIGEYGFIALVIDTEGNMIGLHSMK